MKATLEYNLPEDMEEYELAMNGGAAHSALVDIAQQVFRPARKHGYSYPELKALAEGNEALIAKLEELFYTIVEERGLTL